MAHGNWKRHILQMEKMNTRLQIKITFKQIKLGKCDTTFRRALEKFFPTVTGFLNLSFFKTI